MPPDSGLQCFGPLFAGSQFANAFCLSGGNLFADGIGNHIGIYPGPLGKCFGDPDGNQYADRYVSTYPAFVVQLF